MPTSLNTSVYSPPIPAHLKIGSKFLLSSSTYQEAEPYPFTSINWRVDTSKPTEYHLGALYRFYTNLKQAGFDPASLKPDSGVSIQSDDHLQDIPLEEIVGESSFIIPPQHSSFWFLRIDTPYADITMEPTTRSYWTPATGRIGVLTHLPLTSHLAKLITETSGNEETQKISTFLAQIRTFKPSH